MFITFHKKYAVNISFYL